MNINQLPTAYQPEGALGGIFAGINAANAQTANDLGFEQSILENIVKQKEAAVAQRQQASDPWMQAQLDKDIGASREAMAKGDLAQGTLASNISSTNAENTAKSRKAEFESRMSELSNNFVKLQELAKLNEGASGLEFTTRLQQAAPALGLDPMEYQQLIQMPEADRTDFILSRLNRARTILQQAPDIIKHIAKTKGDEEAKAPMEREKLSSQEKIQAAHDARALSVAKMQENRADKRASSASKLEEKFKFQEAQAKYKADEALHLARGKDLIEKKQLISMRKLPANHPERLALAAEEKQLDADRAASKAAFSTYKNPETSEKETDVIDLDNLPKK